MILKESSKTADRVATELFEAGRSAAHHIWFHWGKTSYVEPDDPLTPEFATGALQEFERLQEDMPGVLEAMADGAHKGAQQLNLDDYHGVMEVLQNADDLFASEVVMSLQTGDDKTELFIVHNGEPVVVHHVLAMAFAFLSTKTENARQKGKFGVGLKTLGRIADRMEVHSNTYSFSIEQQRVRKAEPCPMIGGIYNPGNRSTLLRLRLLPTFDEHAFVDWFTNLDASVLLFLDTVNSFRLLLPENKFKHALEREKELKKIKVGAGKREMEVFSYRCHDRASHRSWIKFEVEINVPKTVSRSHKKTGDTTRLGIALPEQLNDKQGFFAGLPTYIKTDLPFSIEGQFDPDTSREALLHNAWNKWLISQIGVFISELTVNCFLHDPVRAWALIPLQEEMGFADSQLEDVIREAFHSARERIKKEAVFNIEGKDVGLSEIAFEIEALEGLLDASDCPLVSEGKIGLPLGARDEAARWRKVLKELECCKEVDVVDAFSLFHHENICNLKSPEWFVDMLVAALITSQINPIFESPCILLETGVRIPAQAPDTKTTILVRKNSMTPLANFELVYALHPVYYTNSERWRKVEPFFLENTNYATESRPLDLLTAFVNRYETAPIKLADRDLKEVKSLFDSSYHLEPGMGHRLGRSVLLEGYRWNRGKKIRCEAIPSACYIPAGLVKDKAAQWAVAAGKTPGVTWISSRYKQVFSGSRKIAAERSESPRKVSGATKFLRALGAEIAPRVESQPERRRLPYPLPRLQAEALKKLNNKPEWLSSDFVSPDIDAVVASIRGERKKTVRKERGIALFEAIAHSWERLYSETATCSTSYFYYIWRYPGGIPSTWVAHLAGDSWLMNQNNEPKTPRDLVIRTAATRGVYGEAPKLFAAGLNEDHCSSEFPSVIGMETNPRGSGIIDQIRRMRDGKEECDQAKLMQLYGALANIAGRIKSSITLSSAFDDITVARLRSAFGQGAAQGLLYVNGQWASLETVRWGRDIFHGRRLFVPSGKKLESLWRVLGLRHPNLDDCLGMLREIAKRPQESSDEPILIDTYRYLNGFADRFGLNERRRLAEIPLWCGDKWVKSRPIFLINDASLAKNFSTQIAVWTPPCSLVGMPKLTDALKVTVVDPKEYRLIGITPTGAMAGEQERPRFIRAIDALEEYFARTDDHLYKAIRIKWEIIRQIPINLSEHLAVEWTAPELPTISSGIRAHGTLEPFGLYFRSADEIGEKDAGGRVIAECFFPEHCREQVALAWVWKWQEAMKCKDHNLSLASEQTEEPEDKVIKAIGKSKGKKSTYERGTAGGSATTSQESNQTIERKLKDFFSIGTVSVTQVNGGAPLGGIKEPARKGLKDKIPPGPPAGTPSMGTGAGRKTIIAYTQEELEEKALCCLHHVLQYGGLGRLEDFRKFRGIGADAVIELKKFFEIKASACEMPDRVELTLNELDRARISSDSFYLVVVSGLEEGYETVLHLYKNPLRTLDWSPSRSIIVSGLKSKKAIEVSLEVDQNQEGETTNIEVGATG